MTTDEFNREILTYYVKGYEEYLNNNQDQKHFLSFYQYIDLFLKR